MTVRMVALSDLFQIGSSKRVLKSQWKTEGVPFYRGREITRLAGDGFVDNELFISEEHFAELAGQYGVPKVGDIVITAIGTIGNSHVVREKDRFYFKDASVLWMKRTADVSSEFINLWLKSPLFFDQLDKGNGATVDTLTIQKLQSVRLHLPTFTEQHRIVAILDEAFEGIATAKANAEKTLQNAHALFESHLQAVFSQRGEDWMEKPLGELCERITKGSSPKWQGVAYVDKPGVLFVTSENVGEYGLLMQQPKYVEEKFNTKDKKSILRNGDVLTNIVGASIGRTAVFDLDEVANINQAVCLIRCDSTLLNNYYLTYLLNSPVFKQVLHDNEIDNARANLSLGFFSQLIIPLPTTKGQRSIVAQLDEFRAETQRLESIYQQKIAALDELKKSLLHRAFSGEL